MEHPTLDYIKGLRSQLETKKAEIVGQDPNTIPGHENDKPIPAGAKAPDKETKDQTMVPNSGLTTSGAGDDSPITHKNDLTAEQAALTPKKEPEVTGNAEAQVPGGKTAEEKTAEVLGAEILAGVDSWFKAKKEAEAAKQASAAQETAKEGEQQKAAEAGKEQGKEGEQQKAAADTQGPSSGTGTAEALITDTGKEPEQTKDVKGPNKKPEETPDAMKPATGEGSSGETADAAKAAEAGKEAECCKDGKCGKCSKCKAAAKEAAEAKKAGALDMELTQDVLAKIAAIMLATEEGTKLAEATLAKAAGAEAAGKTLEFLREQDALATKQAEYEAGRRDALMAILKQAQEDPAAGGSQGGDQVSQVADTLDAMVQSGEITEDEADQIVVELAQALAGAGDAATADGGAAGGGAADGGAAGGGAGDAGTGKSEPEKKEAQDAGAAAGDAAINNAVAVPPEQLDAGSVPQGGLDDITPDEVASAIDTLVQGGEITEDEADQLVQEITGGAAEGAAGGAANAEVSPKEVATAIQEAVQSGDLKPEDAQAILSELEGVPAPDDAGSAPAAAETQAAAPGASAQAAVTPSDEPKTAGAKLLAAINAARAQKKASAAAAGAGK